MRHLMRACGANEDVMKPLVFAEGLLGFLKTQDAKARGQATKRDLEKDLLSYLDDVEANDATCAKAGREMDPILKAIQVYVDCNEKRKASAALGECPVAIYRAPTLP